MAGAIGALASALPAIIAAKIHANAVAAERSGLHRLRHPRPHSCNHLLAAHFRHRSRTADARRAAASSIACDRNPSSGALQHRLIRWRICDPIAACTVAVRRFQLSIQAAAWFFFVTGLLGAFSQLASSWLAARIGRIRTMAYTHIPANLCLMIAGTMPTAALALGLLLLRASMSSMDVPARQSYVMAVVPPEERTAAASVTNVPRSLASAMAPLPAGVLLNYSLFGWPLILGGACRLVYDALLLAQFRSVKSFL